MLRIIIKLTEILTSKNAEEVEIDTTTVRVMAAIERLREMQAHGATLPEEKEVYVRAR